MKREMVGGFEKIAATDNLLEAWHEFLPGKRNKRDVQEFQLRLIDNILSLRADLINGTYRHGGYEAFNISDPKPRNIHKAAVRDRLLHHAIYRVLYPFFDRTFISDSFSCRDGKGSHAALIGRGFSGLGAFPGSSRLTDGDEAKDNCENCIASNGRNHSFLSWAFAAWKHLRTTEKISVGYGISEMNMISFIAALGCGRVYCLAMVYHIL